MEGIATSLGDFFLFRFLLGEGGRDGRGRKNHRRTTVSRGFSARSFRR